MSFPEPITTIVVGIMRCMRQQSMHLRFGKATSSLLVIRPPTRKPPAAAAQAASSTMAAIEGPKEVTDVLTDLNNKYEAVRAFELGDLG